MQLEQPIADATDASAPIRDVSVKRGKQRTNISATCEVAGSIAFYRTPKPGKVPVLIRWLGLTPPLRFSDGIHVYGLDAATLARIQQDEALSAAIEDVVAISGNLSLQDRRLGTNAISAKARRSIDLLKSLTATAATQLERFGDRALNDAFGSRRLSRPYQWLMGIPVAICALCNGLLDSTLEPSTIALYAFVMALVIAAGTLRFAVPSHLRKHPLGGAIVWTAVLSTATFAIASGLSVAMLGNTVVGGWVLPARPVQVSGRVGIRRGKNMHCWLALDQPSTTIVAGMQIRTLPLTCPQVHFHGDTDSRPYLIDVNPGALGAPFVQSIRATDDNPND